MAIADARQLEIRSILIRAIRQVRESLPHLRSKSVALATQVGRVVHGTSKRGKPTVADQADDLGIPTKPARAAPTSAPTPAPDPPRSTVQPARAPMPLLIRPGNQPAPTPVPPRPNTDQRGGRSDDLVEPRKLIVGQGIYLSGEINACDRLVIEGSVRANLQSCAHMTIAESGLFEGNAVIDEAEIRGRFDGDLVVHKRLLIRATGRVSGTIAYGEIEIEAGGKISGTIQAP